MITCKVLPKIQAVFDLLMGSAGYAEKVQANTERFRTQMTSAGFIISGDNHPICPVMIGDARLATDMANEMLDRGIYVVGFSYPVVPKGKARIRVQISASHSFDDIDETVEAFKQIGKKFKVNYALRCVSFINLCWKFLFQNFFFYYLIISCHVFDIAKKSD
ncbi:hypothetical protein Avbf_16776 [Armadillidium vulgare]|nr:hypothetical protein Avbf_16776 [Armadillidium vulgare]